MDTITHGIAGALLAKAIFRGEDMFGSRAGVVGKKNGSTLRSSGQEATRLQGSRPASPAGPGQAEGGSYGPSGQRIVTWALMLGAIFPDSDVFRDIFSHDKLLVVTWHRSITHSLLLLPLWALLLAGITHWFAKSKDWRLPVGVLRSRVYGVAFVARVIDRWLAKKKEWEAPSFAALSG